MLNIDKEIYWIKESNRYKNQTPKTQIVLASSLRANGYHITRLQHKDFGDSKAWNTYTVTREGLIYQHYDPKNHADFLGIKDADKQSISIVLENMGYLFETPAEKYINWINEICDKKLVVKKSWLGYNYWEKYTDQQIENTVELCSNLCDQFGIPKNMIEFRNYHKDIIKFKGIVFRSNYFEDSNDINPLFSIPKFNEKLQGEFV